MKKRNYLFIILFQLYLFVLFHSCVSEKEDVLDKANVAMTFSARSLAGGSGLVETALKNERLQTLRVIVVRTDGKIVYNQFYDNVSGGSKTILFRELSVSPLGEDFEFYAIGNENAFLRDSGQSLDGKSIDLRELKRRMLQQDFNSPALSLLPQSGYAKIRVVPGENRTETMHLGFPVGKFVVRLNNETVTDVTLEDLKIVSAAPAEGFLFPDPDHRKAGVAKFPDKDILFGNAGNLVVPLGSRVDAAWTVRYVYPGKKSQGSYKLSARWNGKLYETLLTSPESPLGISSVNGGYQYNIGITLTNTFSVSMEVEPWRLDETVVDYTSGFSGVFSPGLSVNSVKVVGKDTDSPAVAVATSRDGKERAAIFSFKMLAPLGARWSVHLENTADFALKGVTDGLGAKNAIPVEFKVVPKRGYNAASPQHIKLFIAVEEAWGGGPPTPQVINPRTAGEGMFPGTETEIFIRQVSETIYDQLSDVIEP